MGKSQKRKLKQHAARFLAKDVDKVRKLQSKVYQLAKTY